MARLHGIRERFDRHLYDTVTIEGATSYTLFGPENIGDRWRTNLRVPYQALDPDYPFVVLGLGLSLLGFTREEEEPLLDYFRVVVEIGDVPRADVVGRLLSLRKTTLENWMELRATFLQPTIRKLAADYGYTGSVVTAEDVQVAMDWLHQLPDQDVTWEEPSVPWQGYQLRMALVIAMRMSFRAQLFVRPTFYERWTSSPLEAQVTLFGMSTRDV